MLQSSIKKFSYFLAMEMKKKEVAKNKMKIMKSLWINFFVLSLIEDA